MKIHKVKWTKEKINNLWEIYETYPEFVSTKFLPDELYINLLRVVKKFIKPKSKILDVGCGTGTLLNLLLKNGYKCYGVDISEKNILQLKQKFPEINFVQGSITKIPFPESYFDCIFVTEILEHLLEEDLVSGLKENKRVLKPQGKLIITVPYKEELQSTVCPDCGAVFVPSQHLRSFDENYLSSLLIRCGFKILFMKLVPKLPIANDSLIKKSVKKMLYLLSKKAVMFMYGSIFITVAEKQ